MRSHFHPIVQALSALALAACGGERNASEQHLGGLRS